MHDSHTVCGQNIRDSDRNFDYRYISLVCDRQVSPDSLFGCARHWFITSQYITLHICSFHFFLHIHLKLLLFCQLMKYACGTKSSRVYGCAHGIRKPHWIWQTDSFLPCFWTQRHDCAAGWDWSFVRFTLFACLVLSVGGLGIFRTKKGK